MQPKESAFIGAPRHPRLSRAEFGILGLGLAIYLFLALNQLTLPGPYYDEFLFVKAALAKPFYSRAGIRLDRFPIFIGEYLGALKAWIYLPIFKIFGVSMATVRIPMVLLGTATLSLYFLILRRFIKSDYALAASFLLLSIDPAFSFVSRIDWGPNALAHFLSALCLVYFFWFLDCGKTSTLFVMLLSAGAGVFDKPNFLWIASGWAFAAIVFMREEIIRAMRENLGLKLGLVALFGLLLSAASIYWILPQLHRLPAPPEDVAAHKLAYVYSAAKAALNSSSVFELVFDKPFPLRLNLAFGSFLIGLCLLPCIDRNASGRAASALALCIVLIFTQIWMTSSAGGPHHILIIWPMHWLYLSIVAFGGVLSNNTLESVSRILLGGVLAAALLGAFLFHHQLNEGDSWNPRWSPKIYSLAEKIIEINPRAVICADWGLCKQLFALSRGHGQIRFLDDWPRFWETPGAPGIDAFALKLRKQLASGRRVLLVRFGDPALSSPRCPKNAELLAQLAGKGPLSPIALSDPNSPYLLFSIGP